MNYNSMQYTAMWLLAATAYAVAHSGGETFQNFIPELYPAKICEEGATFHDSCNICICNKDGTRKFCSQNSCSFWSKLKSPFSSGSGCESGQIYKVGCQICECDDEGANIVCPEGPCLVKGPVLKKYFHLRN